MLFQFLEANRKQLIERCRAKVAARRAPRATAHEMEHGIPLFLAQMIETLRIEQQNAGPREVDRNVGAELVQSATQHGRELLQHGFTIDQVVHDYGDLCQAVTELAVERDVQVSSHEFNIFNRCLDNAIADAVTEFARERDDASAETDGRAASEHLGSVAHELRNSLNTAMMSLSAIKAGGVGLNGATSAVLDRSLLGMRQLIDRTLADARLQDGHPPQLCDFALDRFIAEVQVAATLEAKSRNCGFVVGPVDAALRVRGDKQTLYSALSNLLHNAFKFTKPGGQVWLGTHGTAGRVRIEVADRCGGLPAGRAETMFLPIRRLDPSSGGTRLGLSIARRAVEASGGLIEVRDEPGIGCIFTIDLPRLA